MATLVGPFFLGLLALAALAGCTSGEDTGASPTGSGALTDTATLPANARDFYEVNLNMAKGARAEYGWTAEGSPVYFDIHRHAGGRVEFVDRGEFASRNGSFAAPADGILSLFWENRSDQAVSLDFHVSGNFRVDSVHEPR